MATPKSLKDFTGLYKISETLSFALIPMGNTAENLEKSGLLEKDFTRSDAYPRVKDFLDEQYKKLLEHALANLRSYISKWDDKEKLKKSAYVTEKFDINWEGLHEDFVVFSSAEDDKAKDPRDEVRAIVSKVLATDENYKDLTAATPKDFFKRIFDSIPADQQKAVGNFTNFSCYFKGFMENRKNIFSAEAQATSAANRAVNENFIKFSAAVANFKYIQGKYPEIIANAESELESLLNGRSLESLFQFSFYSNFLPQSGIDYFNQIIGGISEREGGRKIRGLNEFINLYRQQHPDDAAKDRSMSSFRPLYKQILSDRDTLSFIPEKYEDDRQLCDSVLKFNGFLTTAEMNGEQVNVLSKLKSILATLKSDDELYISADGLTDVSVRAFHYWGEIKSALADYAERQLSTKKDREKFLKRKHYSFADLKALNLKKVDEQGTETPFDIANYWSDADANKIFDDIESTWKSAEPILKKYPEGSSNLRENKDDIATIKEYLDAVQELLHFVKPLSNEANQELSSGFTQTFAELYDKLLTIIPLYNHVRNYATEKIGETDKIKLMFNNGTLADGWDVNKEMANTCILFEKDGLYFLGIMNPKQKTDFSKVKYDFGPYYRKVNYKLLPNPHMSLPKAFFCKKGLPIYAPSAALLKNYEAKAHIKSSAAFNRSFCHELIDFFKASIEKHPDWRNFGFQFSPTESYESIDQFYKEISDQGYNISFSKIPEEKVDELVNSGALFLFQIYNKDFAPGAHGRPNKFTLYWKSLFDPDNLANVVFKLSGEAEIFLREPGIENPVVHKAGSKVVNRVSSDGKVIPEAVHHEIYNFANGRTDLSSLSPEAMEWYRRGTVVIKEVNHDIVKDRRFTERKYLFHVPIQINFRSPDMVPRFNDFVWSFLKGNSDVNIIGIDRGERNLIYISVIDQHGKILEQRSFNSISRETYDGNTVSYDYWQKLDQKEKERAAARKNWDTIGKIKDLKDGYLSVVVHEIAKLMVKHNAVVVMEDLNFGFKRGRFPVEKQVYQKFERALIDKLNYLVFKDTVKDQPGGVLNGYQLTNKFESFEKLGKQSGFLFYVPAGYTSKIDPVTGFVNIFDMKSVTNAESRRDFLAKFCAIRYSAKDKAFVFEFNYDNFKMSQESFRKEWTVISAERRLVFNATERKTVTVSPTAMILQAVQDAGIELKDNLDLLAHIRNGASDKLVQDVFIAFRYTLQMRNSDSATGEDYIESPVPDRNGNRFRSKEGNGLPQDADANGAYHIALKGLLLLQRNSAGEKVDMKIANCDWFKFVQNHEF